MDEMVEKCLLLIVTQGEPAGASVEIESTPTVVGRADECHLRLQDLLVSRRHCQVWREHDRFLIRDMGSTNGTCVNRAPALACELFEGDEVTLGQTKLRLVSVETAARFAVLSCKATPVRSSVRVR